jgi:hypothetical protein
MVSAEQTVEAEEADIQFEKSKKGRLVHCQVHLEGKSLIQSAAVEHLPPARFEALRIDYDFLIWKSGCRRSCLLFLLYNTGFVEPFGFRADSGR